MVVATLPLIPVGDFELVVIKTLAQLIEQRLDDGYMHQAIMGPWLQMQCLALLSRSTSPDRDAIIGLIQRVIAQCVAQDEIEPIQDKVSIRQGAQLTDRFYAHHKKTNMIPNSLGAIGTARVAGSPF